VPDTLIFGWSRRPAGLRLLGHFLRFYSYVFETALCAAGLLLGAFALTSSNIEVRVPWLPWTGTEQMKWIVGLSIAGIFSVALASFGTLRSLLFLFSAIIAGILIRGLFLNTQYSFAGRGDARNAAILVSAALLALIGAYPGFAKPRRRRA
jgi:hypothetical protein